MEEHLQEISHGAVHDHCPKDMEGIPNVTGCYSLDAVIARSKNKDMLGRLNMYIKGDTYNSGTMNK
jgi:hypothetical protein